MSYHPNIILIILTLLHPMSNINNLVYDEFNKIECRYNSYHYQDL